MSATLLEFARSFVRGRLPADVFSIAYMELWKVERDAGTLLNDEDTLSEKLSSIFCAADLYNSDPDKEEYELDENQLIKKVSDLI